MIQLLTVAAILSATSAMASDAPQDKKACENPDLKRRPSYCALEAYRSAATPEDEKTYKKKDGEYQEVVDMSDVKQPGDASNILLDTLQPKKEDQGTKKTVDLEYPKEISKDQVKAVLKNPKAIEGFTAQVRKTSKYLSDEDFIKKLDDKRTTVSSSMGGSQTPGSQWTVNFSYTNDMKGASKTVTDILLEISLTPAT